MKLKKLTSVGLILAFLLGFGFVYVDKPSGRQSDCYYVYDDRFPCSCDEVVGAIIYESEFPCVTEDGEYGVEVFRCNGIVYSGEDAQPCRCVYLYCLADEEPSPPPKKRPIIDP